MARRLALLTALGAVALAVVVPATATTGKGSLFHDGDVVGTVVTPSPIAPGTGTDPFYSVTNGASGQLGIAGVAPGDGPYHGGSWAPRGDVQARRDAVSAHLGRCRVRG